MLVTFRTKAFSDISMFGDVASRLIKLMGHSGTIPSALKAEEVPAALEKLKSAIEQGAQMTRADDAADANAAADGEDGDDGVDVSLKHRALPLIELLEAAQSANEHVMWDN